jgi:hypothetical protein
VVDTQALKNRGLQIVDMDRAALHDSLSRTQFLPAATSERE